MNVIVKVLLFLSTIVVCTFPILGSAAAGKPLVKLQEYPSLTQCYYKNFSPRNACYQISTTSDEHQISNQDSNINIDTYMDGNKVSSLKKTLCLEPKQDKKLYVFSIQDQLGEPAHTVTNVHNALFSVKLVNDEKPGYRSSTFKKGYYVTINAEKPSGVKVEYGKFPTIANQPGTNADQSVSAPVLLTSSSDDGLLHGNICFYNGAAVVGGMGTSSTSNGPMFVTSGDVTAGQWYHFNIDGYEPGVYWVRIEYYYVLEKSEWRFVDDGKYNIGKTLIPGQTVNLRGTMFKAWTDVSNDC